MDRKKMSLVLALNNKHMAGNQERDWKCNAPISVMFQKGETLGLLTQTNIKCQNPHHRSWLIVRIFCIPQVPRPLLIQDSILEFPRINKSMSVSTGVDKCLSSESPAGLPIIPLPIVHHIDLCILWWWGVCVVKYKCDGGSLWCRMICGQHVICVHMLLIKPLTFLFECVKCLNDC